MLLLEENKLGCIWILKDSLEVHCVKVLVLSLDCFLKEKVVMSLLKIVKGNILVVLSIQSVIDRWMDIKNVT